MSEATRTALPMTERELLGAVVEAAKLGGWLCYHTWSSVHSPAGFPDIVLCRGREVIFAELKNETAKLRPDQKVWLDGLRAAGIRAECWRPSDLDGVLEHLLARPER